MWRLLHINREYFFVNGLLHKKPCSKSGDVEDVERIDMLSEKSVDPKGMEPTEHLEKEGAV